MIKLRDYQVRGEKLLRMAAMKGYRRIIYWLQTGGGKGAAMADLAAKAALKGHKTLVVMRRRELIFQTRKNFKNYCGLQCSIIMGQEKGFDPNCNIQICSIDTIRNRIKKPEFNFLKEFDIVQVDEMQDTTSPSYRNLFQWIGDEPLYIGFSATPFEVGNQVHDFWDTYVKPIEAHELRDRGYLVPAKMYAPTKIDTKGLKMKGGDFDNVELFDRVSKLSVVGDIVDTYKKYGQDKPAILFAVNKAHSQIMAEAFRQAGIPAIHQDESHTSQERQAAIDGVKSGQFKILCNVNIFSTGVDIPCVEVGIMARPSMSEILVCQQWGRMLRPFKICGKCSTEYGGEKECPACDYNKPKYEKSHAIFLDHAGNCDRHGFPYDIRQACLTKDRLKKKKKEKKNKPIDTITCESCFAIYEKSEPECPECGFTKKGPKPLTAQDGELKLYSEEDRDNEFTIKINKFLKSLRWRVDNGFGQGDYIARKIFEKYDHHAIRLKDRLNLTDQEKKELDNVRKKRLLQSASDFAQGRTA